MMGRRIAKPELLAPAGTLQTMKEVLQAGADAAYCGGKNFNMRLHRSDFNLSGEELAEAVEWCHERGKKIYVTVNSLLGDEELSQLAVYLELLEEIGVDAIIVQDLGVLHLANELGLQLEKHASTMMNVHSSAMAASLAELGVTRIITSRDVTLAQVRSMWKETGLEFEYFIHGDMCIAQSGQCFTSGVLFGESSNRGRCLKPCRWPYDLVDAKTGSSLKNGRPGPYLLARNDMCMIQNIPEMVDAGICSFKIEGRMRPAEFLKPIVRAYRKEIDRYWDAPYSYRRNKERYAELHNSRIRDFSSCHAFGNPGSSSIGFSGKREPRFFSDAPRIASQDSKGMADLAASAYRDCQRPYSSDLIPRFAVRAGSPEAAYGALEAGADLVYIGGEVFSEQGTEWTDGSIGEFVGFARSSGRNAGIATPRIATARELWELERLFQSLADQPIDSVLATNLGTLRLVNEYFPGRVVADFNLCILNTGSIKLMRGLKAQRFTPAPEASLEQALSLSREHILPAELIVHGPALGAILEHCIPAANIDHIPSSGNCPMPCHNKQYALKDKRGQIYPLMIDQYCRNHLLLPFDVCLLPLLARAIDAGVHVLRIEGQYYEAEHLKNMVGLYRREIDRIAEHKDLPPLSESDYKKLIEISPRPFGMGAYARGALESLSHLREEELSCTPTR